ncbi:MAG TPA: ATP-grasp domain-containing protein [Bacteroidota bacterium]|nr:ATP-grasp domain-containing protein [Bacteroidota bacterium]
MKKSGSIRCTVLVTSVGTASGINVIKSLRRAKDSEIKILGVDADPTAAGLYLSDKSFTVPRSDSPEYVPRLESIVRSEGVAVLIPIHSKEIEQIALRRRLFEDAGAGMLVPEPSAIALCNDKRRMGDEAKRLGIRTPHILDADELGKVPAKEFPLFAKPNTGSSSTGSTRIEDKVDLEYVRKKHPEYLFQKFVAGREVTVDVLTDRRQNPIVISPRTRLATKSGQSVKGTTVNAEPFKGPVELLVRSLGLVGPSNIQFILGDEGPVLVEINPRYAAGGLMLTVQAGANIPLLALKETLGMEVTKEECRVAEGVSMSRYWEEVYWNDAIKS